GADDLGPPAEHATDRRLPLPAAGGEQLPDRPAERQRVAGLAARAPGRRPAGPGAARLAARQPAAAGGVRLRLGELLPRLGGATGVHLAAGLSGVVSGHV